MKTLRLIGLTFMMVLVAGCFTACSSDDDDSDGGGGSSKSLIVGRWILTEAYDSNGETMKLRLEDDGEGFEFDTGGTFTFYYGGYRLGKSWKDIWDDDDCRMTGTYSLDGDRLILHVEGTTGSHTILSLTKDRLKIRNSHNQVVIYERFSY